jgi:general secretion pathway protein F
LQNSAMSKTNHPISFEQLARLFTQLKRLEASGLPASQAFDILIQSEDKLKKPLSTMRRQLYAGLPISEAGFRAGIFNDTHTMLIQAGETSERLAEVYGQLANYYTGLSSRVKKIKSRLYFPILVLIVALFMQPLPDLIASKISGFDYLQLSLGRLIVIGSGVFLLIRLPGILCGFGAEKAWHDLQLRISVVANWLTKRQLNEFFFILAMMLESGIAFAVALPKAVATIKNSSLKASFSPAISALSSGASAADTLAKVPIINATILQIVSSSEQSGKLASGIMHFTKLEAETIGLQDDTLAEWLPRLGYILIASWMAYSILGSQFTTVMPDNI